MVGMSQIKKKIFEGIAIGAAIGVVGIGLTIWWAVSTIKSYENGTNDKYNRMYTQDVYVLKKEVIQGELITEDMLTSVNVHKRTVPTGVLDMGSIINQVAKYNIAANVPLTDSMITSEIISADVREQEVNTVLMPSDLEPGQNVDIRIMYPNGTDYIVLAQEQVYKIEGQTMWIKIGEDERLLLNSAIVDSFLKPGTKLYATKYADSDAQIKISDDAANTAEGYVTNEIKKQLDTIKTSDEKKLTDLIFDLVLKYKNFASTVTRTSENYQPNAQVMSLIKSNGQIVNEAKNKLSEEARTTIENNLSSYESQNEKEYNNVVTGAQQSISNQQTQRDALLNGGVAQ